jgi:hypothetical protein
VKFHGLTSSLFSALLLGALATMCGCGGGGSSAGAPVSKPTLSLVSSGNGHYSIQGSNMDGVTAIQLTVSYDRTAFSSPTVTEGALTAGLFMAANTGTPGSITIGMVGTNPLAGSGPIAAIDFTTATAQGAISISSVSMIDQNGTHIQ